MKVLKYYFRPDDSSREVLQDHAFRAHEYYQNLLALRIESAERYRKIRARHDPELAELEEKISAYQGRLDAKERLSKQEREEMKQLRAQAKQRRDAFAELCMPADTELRRRSGKPTKEDLKGLSLSERRAKMLPPWEAKRRNEKAQSEMVAEKQWPEVWREILRNQKMTAEKARDLRANSGVAHGTYYAVELAVDAAMRDSFVDPRLPNWRDGEGARKVGLQVNNQARVRLRDIGQQPKPKRARRASARLYEVEVDIGGCNTIRGTAIVHRPILGQIKWAYFMPLKRMGRWELQLTVSSSNDSSETKTTAQSGTAILELNHEPIVDEHGGVLVATINRTEEVYLPEKLVRRLSDRPSSLRMGRDVVFDMARSQWLALYGGEKGLPEWQRHLCMKPAKGPEPEKFVAPYKWRGSWRLRLIAREWADRTSLPPSMWAAWKSHRLKRGKDLFDEARVAIAWAKRNGATDEEQACAFWLYTWLRKDQHMMEMETRGRARAVLARREMYRVLAARLSRQFGDVIVVKSDLASRAKSLKLSRREDKSDPRSLGRFIASGYALVEAVKNACDKRCSVVTLTEEELAEKLGSHNTDE